MFPGNCLILRANVLGRGRPRSSRLCMRYRSRSPDLGSFSRTNRRARPTVRAKLLSKIVWRKQSQKKKKKVLSQRGKDSNRAYWIDLRTVQRRPEHFKSTVWVFRKTVLVRRWASGQVDPIHLRDACRKGTGREVDLLSIICSTWTIDIKTSQNLCNRFINPKNDLDMTSRVLRCDSDGVFRSNSGCFP